VAANISQFRFTCISDVSHEVIHCPNNHLVQRSTCWQNSWCWLATWFNTTYRKPSVLGQQGYNVFLLSIEAFSYWDWYCITTPCWPCHTLLITIKQQRQYLFATGVDTHFYINMQSSYYSKHSLNNGILLSHIK